jgi:hypothetical protein
VLVLLLKDLSRPGRIPIKDQLPPRRALSNLPLGEGEVTRARSGRPKALVCRPAPPASSGLCAICGISRNVKHKTSKRVNTREALKAPWDLVRKIYGTQPCDSS